MTPIFVKTSDRPDLVAITGRWRWEAFNRGGSVGLEEVLARETQCAGNDDVMPTVLVMLEDQIPIAMITLCLDDIEERPELNPWMAGVYVDTAHRGKGHALRLIEALETFARQSGIPRLSLYTSHAAGLYSKAGWTTIETFEKNQRTYSIMQKHL